MENPSNGSARRLRRAGSNERRVGSGCLDGASRQRLANLRHPKRGRHVFSVGRTRGPNAEVDYIGIDPETAKAAAMFALSKKSGQHTCSGWELHTHIAHE